MAHWAQVKPTALLLDFCRPSPYMNLLYYMQINYDTYILAKFSNNILNIFHKSNIFVLNCTFNKGLLLVSFTIFFTLCYLSPDSGHLLSSIFHPFSVHLSVQVFNKKKIIIRHLLQLLVWSFGLNILCKIEAH